MIAGATAMLICVVDSAARAGGNQLLSGINLDFWSGSSSGGGSTDHHRERGERISHLAGQDCWFETRWQKTRHGNRFVEKVRVCN